MCQKIDVNKNKFKINVKQNLFNFLTFLYFDSDSLILFSSNNIFENVFF